MKGGLVELPAGTAEHGNYRAVLRAADHRKPLVTAVSGFSAPFVQTIEEKENARPIPDDLLDFLARGGPRPESAPSPRPPRARFVADAGRKRRRDEPPQTITIDGEERSPVRGARIPRPDVAAAVPSRQDCRSAGFDATYAFGPGDEDPHNVDALLRSADGRQRHYGLRRFTWK